MVRNIVDEFNAYYYAVKILIEILNEEMIKDLQTYICERFEKAFEMQSRVANHEIDIDQVSLVSLIGSIHAINLLKDNVWNEFVEDENVKLNRILDERYLINETDKNIKIEDLKILREELNIRYFLTVK